MDVQPFCVADGVGETVFAPVAAVEVNACEYMPATAYKPASSFVATNVIPDGGEPLGYACALLLASVP